MRKLLPWILLLVSCAHKAPPPEPEIFPCYKAKTYKEYTRLVKGRALKPNAPLVVGGKNYACVESVLESQNSCYVAKTKKEYDKLSRLQEKQPDWPVKAGGKYYRCIQMLH